MDIKHKVDTTNFELVCALVAFMNEKTSYFTFAGITYTVMAINAAIKDLVSSGRVVEVAGDPYRYELVLVTA